MQLSIQLSLYAIKKKLRMKRNFTLFLFTFIISGSNIFGQETFQMPSEDWKIEIDLDGFEIQKEAYSPDSTMFQLSAIDKKADLNFSIFIEKSEVKGSKEECRSFYWKKAENSPLAKENLKKYETDNLAIVEHDTKEFNGQIVNYHSLNAYLTKNGYWLDIHISKAGYSKKDQKIIKKIIESITIK